MSNQKVFSLADRRAKAEGWDFVPVDFTVFDCGDGYAEVRTVTGSFARGDAEVHAVQVGEEALTKLAEKILKVRDAMRVRKEVGT